MQVVLANSSEGKALLAQLRSRGEADLARVEPAVRAILEGVRARGDAAVLEYTERFEGRRVAAVRLEPAEWQRIAAQAPAPVCAQLEVASNRIRRFHEHQRETGFRYTEDGVELGSRAEPLAAVGVYAPGGKARYPSSVLMSAIPAQIAGVPRIVLATPNPTSEILAAAELAGVTEVLDAGGAQAIAALAYGTQSVTAVDKIVGPGNVYVACAKRLVFGVVAIDQIAGPSEILVLADGTANPKWVAADLLSQAEHDEDAYCLLVTTARTLADEVVREVAAQLATLPRAAIAGESIRRHGVCFVVPDIVAATEIANALAPEHLALCVADPEAAFARIHSAGAVFLGAHTPEAAGDYAAGPSHVLPTGGAARWGSPLGVYDFIRRSSVIRYDPAALVAQRELLAGLARLEGLEAHARAVEVRTGVPTAAKR